MLVTGTIASASYLGALATKGEEDNESPLYIGIFPLESRNVVLKYMFRDKHLKATT